MSKADASIVMSYAGHPTTAPSAKDAPTSGTTTEAGRRRVYRSTWNYLDPYGRIVAMVPKRTPAIQRHTSSAARSRAMRSGRSSHNISLTSRTSIPRPPPSPRAYPLRGCRRASTTYDAFERVSQTFDLGWAPNRQNSFYHALSRDIFDSTDLGPNATPHSATAVLDGFGRTVLHPQGHKSERCRRHPPRSP